MSFGFSIHDFTSVLKTATNVYQACKCGPVEYREICNEVKSLRYAIQGLCEDIEDPDSLINRKGRGSEQQLKEILSNCEYTLEKLQAVVDKHSSLEIDSKEQGKVTRVWAAYQVGSADLDSLRGKLTFHTSTISVFLLSLEGSAISRIEAKLDGVYARLLQYDASQARQSTASLISVASTTSLLSQLDTNEDDVWKVLKRELLAEGISMAHIMANRDEIIDYIKNLLEGDGTPDEADPPRSADVFYGNQEITAFVPWSGSQIDSTIRGNHFEASDEAEVSEMRIRYIEKHLFAEKQLTSTLEEALVDLERQHNRVKQESEDWQRICLDHERRLARNQHQQTARISTEEANKSRKMRSLWSRKGNT